MSIELETLKLRLIETQAELLRYQHREVSAKLQALQNAQAKASQEQDPMPDGPAN